MENARIFVVRTPIMRGSNGSHLYKAGFFCFRIHRIFPIRYAACLYRAFKKRIPRASDGVRSDIWQVAFLSAYTRTPSNYAYQHTYHKRGADSAPCAIAAQGATLQINSKRPWTRVARSDERLLFSDNRNRPCRIVFTGDRTSGKIKFGYGRLAKISYPITRSASAASGTFKVIPKHISFQQLPAATLRG